MLNALLIAGAVMCAFLAIRATHLLTAALWLAGVSALVALTLFRLGAEEVAVVELSVGAGLVTVLFVFAISIAGDDALGEPSAVPWWLALGMVVVFVLTLGALVLPLDEADAAPVEFAFTTVLWEDRALDVLVQLVLIFTGVLGLVGLLKEDVLPADAPPVSARSAPRPVLPTDPLAEPAGTLRPSSKTSSRTGSSAEENVS